MKFGVWILATILVLAAARIFIRIFKERYHRENILLVVDFLCMVIWASRIFLLFDRLIGGLLVLLAILLVIRVINLSACGYKEGFEDGKDWLRFQALQTDQPVETIGEAPWIT